MQKEIGRLVSSWKLHGSNKTQEHFYSIRRQSTIGRKHLEASKSRDLIQQGLSLNMGMAVLSFVAVGFSLAHQYAYPGDFRLQQKITDPIENVTQLEIPDEIIFAAEVLIQTIIGIIYTTVFLGQKYFIQRLSDITNKIERQELQKIQNTFAEACQDGVIDSVKLAETLKDLIQSGKIDLYIENVLYFKGEKSELAIKIKEYFSLNGSNQLGGWANIMLQSDDVKGVLTMLAKTKIEDSFEDSESVKKYMLKAGLELGAIMTTFAHILLLSGVI